ncbi:MAG: hypothetical protein ACYDA6_09675 [Solirubrobacteraceae bacterium]
MPSQIDFNIEIERAAGLTLDATCALRAAALGQLPPPHRRLIGVAIVALEKAQQALFVARNDPWQQPKQPKTRQLELL